MNDDDRIAYLAGEPTGSIDDMDARADLDELRALLADPGLWDEPAPTLEDAVVSAVARAAATPPVRTIAPAPPVAAPTVRSSEAVAPVISIDRHRRWIRPAMLVGAAAAAVIVVVTATVSLTGGKDDAVTFSMALEPTEALPAASGSAELTRTDSGWRIELDATGLPRLDAGKFYQAWLRNDDGVLVPIGTFNEGADVVLWAGVSPVDFPTLTVTREGADNVQDSSGDRVLVGALPPADE
ncbi:MAG TPA: anti-sigma factor [Ilumatobacteraceae bacterium]|nr:anti-sigma factor [Ilumatobacteraceae bacterium]